MRHKVTIFREVVYELIVDGESEDPQEAADMALDALKNNDLINFKQYNVKHETYRVQNSVPLQKLALGDDVKTEDSVVIKRN